MAAVGCVSSSSSSPRLDNKVDFDKGFDALLQEMKSPMNHDALERQIRWCIQTFRELNEAKAAYDTASLPSWIDVAIRTMRGTHNFLWKAFDSFRAVTCLSKRVITFEPSSVTFLQMYKDDVKSSLGKVLGFGRTAEVIELKIADKIFAAKYASDTDLSGKKASYDEMKSTHTCFETEQVFGILCPPSEHVLRPLWFARSNGLPVIVYEKAEKTLADHLLKIETEDELDRIIPQILRGLIHLENHPVGAIVHRDLKADNVLIFSGGRVKLADFGLADVHGKSVAPIPSYWRPPEQFRAKAAADKAEDVWAFGMLILKILTFNDFSKRMKLDDIRDIAKVMQEVDYLLEKEKSRVETLDPSGKFRSALWKCFAVTPEERPTFSQLLIDLSPPKVGSKRGSGEDLAYESKEGDIAAAGGGGDSASAVGAGVPGVGGSSSLAAPGSHTHDIALQIARQFVENDKKRRRVGSN